MSERLKLLISAILFFMFVGAIYGLICMFGYIVCAIIPIILGLGLLSLAMILWIDDHIVNPVGRWWFRKMGRRWDK